MRYHRALRRILLSIATLLLLVLAWGALSGGFRQLPRSATPGQHAETAVQLLGGLLSLLVPLAYGRAHRWARPLLVAWILCLVTAAGLSALVWGPPLPGVALLFSAGALVLTLGIAWMLRTALQR